MIEEFISWPWLQPASLNKKLQKYTKWLGKKVAKRYTINETTTAVGRSLRPTPSLQSTYIDPSQQVLVPDDWASVVKAAAFQPRVSTSARDSGGQDDEGKRMVSSSYEVGCSGRSIALKTSRYSLGVGWDLDRPKCFQISCLVVGNCMHACANCIKHKCLAVSSSILYGISVRTFHLFFFPTTSFQTIKFVSHDGVVSRYWASR